MVPRQAYIDVSQEIPVESNSTGVLMNDSMTEMYINRDDQGHAKGKIFLDDGFTKS